MKTNKVTREQVLSPTENNQDTDIPLMFITMYSIANPNFKEPFSKHWSYLADLVALENWVNRSS